MQCVSISCLLIICQVNRKLCCVRIPSLICQSNVFFMHLSCLSRFVLSMLMLMVLLFGDGDSDGGGDGGG